MRASTPLPPSIISLQMGNVAYREFSAADDFEQTTKEETYFHRPNIAFDQIKGIKQIQLLCGTCWQLLKDVLENTRGSISTQKHKKQSTLLQGKACLLTTGSAEDAIGLRALKVITSSSLDFTSGCQTQTPERKQREANIVRNAISQLHKLRPCCKSKNYLQIRWL